MRLSSGILLSLSILLGACTLNAPELPDLTPNVDNVIYVTATPLPETMVALQANTATPLPPTIPPTPEIDPSVLLQLGDTYVTNGYLEDAIGVYQSLINQGDAIAPEYRAVSAFRLGQVALRDGFFQQAVDALTLLITQFPDNSQTPQAYFLRGDAYLGLSQWQLAINDLQQYLALRPSLIDSYAYERIADAQIALGQTDTALQNYELAINAKRSLVPLLILREKLAQIYINLLRPADAVAQYDAILSVARNAPYRANISYTAAKALLNSGDVENGIARMNTIFASYPDTATAYQAMQQMIANGADIDGFQQGKSAYIAGDYQATINAFNGYTTTHQLASIPAELHLMLGRAYREIGNSDAATVAFQTIIDQYPQDPLFGEALLEGGRTRFLAGDIPAAILIYMSIADTYDYLTDTAGEALWRVGYLYGTNGEPVLSRQTFTRLADSYPNHELTTNGLFIAASAAVTNDEWSIAENLYSRIASLTTGEDQAAAYLWVGRLAVQRGDQNVANQAFDLATSSAPDSYYSARASDILIGREPFQPPAQYQFAFDVNAEVVAADEWIRQTFGVEATGELWRLSDGLNNDSRMIRGRELFVVGAFDEAFTEFDDLIEEARNNSDALTSYQVAIYLRGIGAYSESIIAAADVIRASGLGTLQVPSFIGRLRYPDYYIDLIRPVAAERAVDPLLILSLIRLESLFNTYATAAAGEKGLMQVIPGTAQYIAERLQWQDYQHSDLFRPYAGVAFGSFYIDEQLDLFDQNTIPALSAYNAGPGRALDWNALSGGDPDLFMTTITIESTRGYVQVAYRNYNIYRALYGMN
jgi:soluble lytic murein transglycosylase